MYQTCYLLLDCVTSIVHISIIHFERRLWSAPEAAKLSSLTSNQVLQVGRVGLCSDGSHTGSTCGVTQVLAEKDTLNMMRVYAQ